METLKVVYKPLQEIHPYEKNPRKNDEAVQYVKNSIEKFGFRNPIIIDGDGAIVAGHTRYKAAQELGMKEVPTISADDLTPEQIKAYRIADNKTAERSEWDNDLLREEITELLGDFNMTEFGFGDFELSILTEDFDPEPYDDNIINKYKDNDEKFVSKKRVIITYNDDQEETVAKMLGIQEVQKVVYDIDELKRGV